MRTLLNLALAAAVLAALCVAPSSRAEPAGDTDGPGIAILASSVDNGQSVEDLMAFVREARVREVVIDWAWITLHWERTKFERVNELAKQLKAEKVNVAAMYRPRFKGFQADKIKVKAQTDAEGKLPENREILYADAEARKWGSQWAVDILTKCPEFDEVVIYNPSQNDQSEASKQARKADPEYDTKSVHSFLSETREAMRKLKPDVKLGMVRPPAEALFKPFRDVVDVERPYVFVLKEADYAEDMDAALEIMKQTKTPGPALAKITWRPDDKVSDEWLAKFIATAREKKLRYCFWTYDTAFLDGTYDLDSLCKAAGLDAAKLKPVIQRLGGKTGLKWPPEEVQKAIDEAMKSDYAAVLKAVEKYGEDAIEPLSKILDDTDRPVFDRWRAAGALGQTKSAKALPVLLRNSRDKEDMVRWLCAEALGWCGGGSKEARERLTEMAEGDPAKRADANGKEIFYVRETARLALTRLSQRKPGEYESFFNDMPWAETLEDALEKGKAEGKLTVLFVNPFDSGVFDCGYREAKAFADRQRARSTPPETDGGFVKERAMLVGLLAEPRAAAFVKQRCAPVKMRLNIMHWTDIYKDEPHALKAIGMADTDVGAPAVLMISPEGKVVAHARNMTLYAPELFHKLAATAQKAAQLALPKSLETALDALAKTPSVENYTAALDQLLDAGLFEKAETLVQMPPAGGEAVASLALAELQLLTGRATEAAAALLKLKPGKELQVRHAALLAEAQVRIGAFEPAVKTAASVKAEQASAWRNRLEFFSALAQDGAGKATEARKLLAELAVRKDSDPWCVRASMYTAAGDPNPEEWCRFSDLPLPNKLNSTESGLNEAAGETESATAIERAVLYLLERQRPDGQWEGHLTAMLNPSGQSMQDFAQVARNALCVMALRRAMPVVSKQLKPRIEKAIEAGSAAVYTWSENPQDSIFAVTYALQMEVELHERLKSAARKASRERARKLVAKLREMEHDGGWTYTGDTERLHTFNTAPIMLALVRVKQLKLDDVDDMLERGAKFLESQRVGKLAVFHYGAKMQHLTKVDDTKSSSMRNTVCELALLHGGFSKDNKRVAETLPLFFKYLDDVRRTTKRWEHFFEPDAMQDAYHYYFGAWYAAQAMVVLKDKDSAKTLTEKLLATQELDGGFCDAQLSCGRNAGTAMALLAMLDCTSLK
ncbi:MAG: HEAT repeat domain-containing protein [Planctomycetes bacterium]|nr:HEAT repeat domain-containing protein [Planctomycetota bacterium]MCB9935807.1 HEAT repeat domain-containing protein [Planctomycetota bacterium]